MGTGAVGRSVGRSVGRLLARGITHARWRHVHRTLETLERQRDLVWSTQARQPFAPYPRGIRECLAVMCS